MYPVVFNSIEPQRPERAGPKYVFFPDRTTPVAFLFCLHLNLFRQSKFNLELFDGSVGRVPDMAIEIAQNSFSYQAQCRCSCQCYQVFLMQRS